jgi:hypothetical protein
MAEVQNISTQQRLNLNDSVVKKTLSFDFGLPQDYIELHIFNQNDQLLSSVNNFTNYTQPTPKEINMDPVQALATKGYLSGKYRLVFNIQRKKIFNTLSKIFTLKEISPSRTELRAIAGNINNPEFDTSVQGFINEIESSISFVDFILNFGQNQNIPGVNLILNQNPNKHEILIKLSQPLPNELSLNNNFNIVTDISDSIIIDIDLGGIDFIDDSINLKGPNFKIDVRLNNSVPSSFKNYNEVLEYTLTSSYQNLLNQLEKKEIPNVIYDYIPPVSSSDTAVIDKSTYHFGNFTNFGSAFERLKNFEYKIKLHELYDSQISEINSITGISTSSSIHILNNKESINTKKTNLIKGFDGYERFLYYNSGSFASWPKSNNTHPYNLYSISSSQVIAWMGDEKDSFPNYGGQLLSASLFDRQNKDNLLNFIPHHITENPDNSFYSTFVNMIGQHFDQTWLHIKHITEKNNAHNLQGISKELVHLSLKSLGLETFDQFENANLIEYILGEGKEGSIFYDAPISQSLVTASNAGSIPKGDITKEIWKRLYHNAPYLLKTKGTERGLKALMSCYGVPSTILNVKEYGGSTSDKTTYKTFSYEKSGLALKGDSGVNGYFIKTPWSSSLTDVLSPSAKTVEFRIKPHRSNENYHLWSLLIDQSQTTYNQHLTLEPYTGNDISTPGDSSYYGRIKWNSFDNNLTSSTEYFPIFNGDFWNIFIGVDGNGLSSDNSIPVNFGAYQSNFNKNINKYTASSPPRGISSVQSKAWGISGDTPTSRAGATNCYIGGLPSGYTLDVIDGLRYSGSIQEVRYHFGELLSHDTLKKHALEPFMYAGNTVSSSYENLVLRLPLGSNDKRDSGSFHPNSDVNYLGGGTSSMTTQTWEEVIETHHLLTPDTVGKSMTSEKVRIDEGIVDDNWLSPTIKSTTSTLDRQPLDYPDLGVFFSPTTEINEDILYTLGSFRLDDYIGSPLPSAQSASVYGDLATIKDIYFKKVKNRYNYWDYIKLIQYIDHTLFKLVEQWVPMKANLKTGLVIEPHFLERNKVKRTLPTTGVDQSMLSNSYQTFETTINKNVIHLNDSSVITTNNLLQTTGSDRQRQEQGTNININMDEYITFEVGQPATSGNVMRGRLSSRYYRRLINGVEQ